MPPFPATPTGAPTGISIGSRSPSSAISASISSPISSSRSSSALRMPSTTCRFLRRRFRTRSLQSFNSASISCSRSLSERTRPMGSTSPNGLGPAAATDERVRPMPNSPTYAAAVRVALTRSDDGPDVGLAVPDLLGHQPGKRHLDPRDHLLLRSQEHLLDLLRRDQSERRFALLDRDDLDLQLAAFERVRRDRVGGLVRRHHLLLALQVLHLLLEADLFGELRLPQVGPRERVASVLEREQQRLVDDVLQHCRRVTDGHARELHVIDRLVTHLGQVVAEDVLATLRVGQPHVHDAVEPPP